MEKTRSLLFAVLLIATLQSHAGQLANYLYRNCATADGSNISSIKFILSRYYNIKSQISSGAIDRPRAEAMWNEEYERFLDHRHEILNKINAEVWRNLDSGAKDLLNLEFKLHGAAILQAASEFYSLSSMPPDARLSRAFVEKCEGIALRSNR